MRGIIVSALTSASVAAAWATGNDTATGKLGDAPMVNHNPVGAQYAARLSLDSKAGINMLAIAETDSDGFVHFTININGRAYPPAGGPYLYHIHDQPVPSNGNCTATLAHLDPYERGETPPCDASQPHTCQVGDLSGKHGTIPSLPGFSASYTDKYLSLIQGQGSFLGNRSIVLHYANKTRIACANWQLVGGANMTGVGYGYHSTSGSPQLTTITSTIASGSYSGSLTTYVSTLGGASGAQSYTTVTSSLAGVTGAGALTTFTSTLGGASTTSPSATATTTAESSNNAVQALSSVAKALGALVIALAAIVA